MKKILILCYPTFGKSNEIHLNSKNTHVVLAPDQYNKYFLDNNIEFDVVSIYPNKLIYPLLNSNIMAKTLNEIDVNSYESYWHMFRDPTQPEVLEILDRININYGNKLIINNVSKIKHLFKDKYYEVLKKYNLSPDILDIDPHTIKWTHHNNSTMVDEDNNYICLYRYNNNRGDYIEREKRSKIVVKYYDNLDSFSGFRSFFRIGYSFGKCTEGWMYYSNEKTFKSGSSKIKEIYHVPTKYHYNIQLSMNELGVDVCHLEGLIYNGELKIFDINPYPTASGSSLSNITLETMNSILTRLDHI